MDIQNDARRLASIGTFFIILGWIAVIYALIAGLLWWIDLAQREAFNILEAFAISASTTSGNEANRTRHVISGAAPAGGCAMCTSNATGSSWLALIAPATSNNRSMLSRSTTIVADAPGSGASLNVALTMAASVPKDPLTTFDRS